jgi:hypothetical protein
VRTKSIAALHGRFSGPEWQSRRGIYIGFGPSVPIAISQDIMMFEVRRKVVSRATLLPVEGFHMKQIERWAVFDTSLGANPARGLASF